MTVKKILSLLLAVAIATGAILSLGVSVNAESPNLIEMYGYDPNFDTSLTQWTTLENAKIERYQDSSDGDGWCVKVSNRDADYSVPSLMGNAALEIFKQQGSGTYYYSFYVKCANSGESVRMRPQFQLIYGGTYSAAAMQSGKIVGKWLYGAKEDIDGKYVDSSSWTKVEMTVTVNRYESGKYIGEAKLYGSQPDFDTNKAYDLLFDNFKLVKKTGSWTYVDPRPETEPPQVETFTTPTQTGIGAIYYHMWFETLEKWWEHDNRYAYIRDYNSVQEARCLSPAQYHYRLPFFATINTQIRSSNYINGDLTKGVAEFGEFTEEIWTQEMYYAADAGVDFMAYMWSAKNRKNAEAFKYHIKTKGLDGLIKMSAVVKSESEDLDTMASAMCEDYWYTVDGMPVVYIYGGLDVCTAEFIKNIRQKLAHAQYAKFGAVGKPAYIIGTTFKTANDAIEGKARGLDAISWYAIEPADVATTQMIASWKAEGATIKAVTFKKLAQGGLDIMKNISSSVQSKINVSPLITLGYNCMPRIENPTIWLNTNTETGLAYNGYTAMDPTKEEVKQNVIDVLAWNYENKDSFKCNTVLINSWNIYMESGWFSPTLACDAQGNVIKNDDGTNKINTEYLEAVKAGILEYRSTFEGITTTPPIQRPHPNQTIQPDVTAAPDNAGSTDSGNNFEKPENEIALWSGAEIFADMFSWNKASDAETGIEHYFDNKTRIINWAVIVVIMGATTAIVLAIVLPSKKKNDEIPEENIEDLFE